MIRVILTPHPVATLVIGPDNRIVSANSRAESLLNMARSALVGSDIERVLRIDDPNVDPSIWSTGKPLSAYDIRVHAGRMEAVEMDVLINPLSDYDGWRIVALHIHTPAQASGLRRGHVGAKSATGAAAMLAHEIKNPLSGIRGAAQLLEIDATDETRPLTTLIRDEVDRIAALIDRMQHFTSNQPLACRAENIYPLLDRAIDLAWAGFARGRGILRRYDPSLPFALINSDALVQIMLNLIKNAVEATEAPEHASAPIIVSTAFRHGISLMSERGKQNAPLQVEIQVIDHGPGVPETIRDVLFNPFISNKRSGQGLGLALVDKLVRDMNGLVQYERDSVTERTIFRLLLPMGDRLMRPLVGKILVVDDDQAICVVIAEALKRAGHTVRTVGSIAQRTAQFAAFEPDVVVTDVMLPDGDGMDDIAALRAERPDLRIIVLSAQNTLNTAVRATGQGAFEYLPKPFDLNELTRAVSEALSSRRGVDESVADAEPGDDMPLIGRSPQMQEVYRTIARVVANDLNILVLGESGTGKELVAEAIHSLGPRRDHTFVAINMAAIPRELIEAELFGYERGAFTGAVARSAGKFEQAQGGTLFLDEIGDMPMEAQTRLLRVLQSGEVTTVGGTRPVRVDVRIIAATNKDLSALIAEGRFREDLYYRLHVVPIHLPALRERASDIPLLARHFLDLAARSGLPRKVLSDDAADLLSLHAWPGNVRELQNLMQRMTVLTRDSVISAGEIRQILAVAGASEGQRGAASDSLEDAAILWARERLVIGTGRRLDDLHDQLLAVVEPVLIAETLAAVDGNQIRAAAILGMNRNTLRKKLNVYDIDPVQPRRND